MQAIANKEVAVGFPKGKQEAYPDGKSLVMVAAIQVFGIGVPQRDFMGLGAKYIALNPDITKAVKEASKTGSVALLEAAGQLAQDEIQNAILEGDWPQNSLETIARKSKGKEGGEIKPLIDSSHMIRNVTYVVRDKQ